MRDLLYRQVKKSTVLKEDVAHFERARSKGPENEDFTYLFLTEDDRKAPRHSAKGAKLG